VSRNKIRAKAVAQEFPHFVEIAIPPGGLGSVLNAMYDFHTRNGIRPERGQWRPGEGGGRIRWCFADEAIAAAFAAEFNAKTAPK
jgi:hypothetical protein